MCRGWTYSIIQPIICLKELYFLFEIYLYFESNLMVILKSGFLWQVQLNNWIVPWKNFMISVLTFWVAVETAEWERKNPTSSFRLENVKDNINGNEIFSSHFKYVLSSVRYKPMQSLYPPPPKKKPVPKLALVHKCGNYAN